MTLKLVVRSKASCEPEELILSEKSYGIGRLHDNDLSIQSDNISGYHAELKQTPDGGYVVSDLNSTNGTFLNENRVSSPEKVKPGDRLKLGNLLITVEEHVEAVFWPENESVPGGMPSKVVSLKDDFGFASGENFNTYPIAPIRTSPTIGNGNGVLGESVGTEEPGSGSGIVARLTERAQRIERAKEAERAEQAARAREAERAQQIERAREAERAQQAERAREAARAQQIERAREAERAQQIARAREAERAHQAERAREAARAQQIERAREAERAEQAARAREAERAQQIERAREAERAEQAARAREAERAEVDLREPPEQGGSPDFTTKVQSLTAQLEGAMREIRRLKAFIAQDSPRPVERSAHAVGPVSSSQSLVRGREGHAVSREGNIEGKNTPTGQERELRDASRQEVRSEASDDPPLRRQVPENTVAFRSVGEVLSHSSAHLRPQSEAPRSAGQRPFENEERPCEEIGRPIE